MQAQFYHMEDIKNYSKSFANSQVILTQDQIKTMFLKIIQNLQELNSRITKQKAIGTGNTPKQNNQSTSQILTLIQMKIFQMEERRKAWDQTMAEIFNQKDQIKRKFDSKLNQLENFEIQITKMSNDMLQKFSQINEDRKIIKSSIEDKANKMKQYLKNELHIQFRINEIIEKQLKQIKSRIQSKQKQKQYQSKERFNFVVTCQFINKNCEEYINFAKKISQPLKNSQTKQQQSQNQKQIQINCNQIQQETNNPEQNLPNCKNMQIIIQNFQNLQTIKNYINGNEEVIQRLQRKILTLGQKLEVVSNKIGDLLAQSIEKSIDKNNFINNSSKQSFQMDNYSNNLNNSIQKSLQRNKQLQLYQANPKNFIQMRSQSLRKFKIDKNLITIIDEKEIQSCFILGCKSIRNLNTFTVQIIKTLHGKICIGITDQKYYNIPTLWNSPNFMVMRGRKGRVYSGSREIVYETGIGFKTGDQVTINVNFNNFTIQWYVNGYLQYTHFSNKLRQNSIIWVPILLFYNTGDSIRWISQQRNVDFV